jgi:hypothetical protein
MCCGQSRDAYRAAEPAPYLPPPPVRAPAAEATPGAPPGEPAVVRLRFREQARVRVRGPASGADYLFSGSEPVRAVHASDVEALLRTGYFSRAY